ncbi:MAG: hypothetical protein JWM36_137 [Hyphomicrobiales bacterium]|nr:hypothetical protein [Hyphomicrobiales bacterium]
MIHKIRVTQIGTLFSEGIDDQPQEPMRRGLVRPARVRVMRLLKEAMTLIDNVPRPSPAPVRSQDRSKSAM